MVSQNTHAIDPAAPRRATVPTEIDVRRINHPVAVDVRYGKGVENGSYPIDLGLYRLALHARRFAFDHPVTRTPLEFESPIPDDLADALRRAGVPEELLAR